MKKLLLFTFVACFSTALFGQTFVSTTPSNKNVILEEFTGRNCQFCPDGHEVANGITANNPGRFWAINIHAGSFSPTSHPNYQCPDGVTIHNASGAASYGYPSGTVNRGSILGRGSWNSATNQQLAQASCVNVAAQGTYNNASRILTLVVEVYYTANSATSTNYLTVAMLQNNIVGPQVGANSGHSQYIGPGQYNHMHMLRDIISPTWGDPITTTTATSFFTKTYTYEIPEHVNNIPVVLYDLEFLVWVSQGQAGQPIITGNYAQVVSETSPRNVEATQSEDNPLSINITWLPPIAGIAGIASGVQGYNIYRNGVKINSTPLSASTNSYSDIVSEYGVTYCYVVTAIIDGDEHESIPFCIQTTVDIPAPINLTVKQLRGKKMLVSWDLPENPYSIKFIVYRNGISQNGYPPVPITETIFESTGASYIQYCFEIESVLNELNVKSANVCITLVNVGKPGDFKAEQVSLTSKEVLLTWNAANNATGYNIYRDNVLINTEPVTSTTYTDVVSEYDVQYAYEVYGVAANGAESENGGTANITLLNNTIPVPNNVQAQNDGFNVLVTWDAVTMNIDGYNIYRNNVKVNTEPVTELEYEDIVTESNNYCYTITAVLIGFEGEKSESACLAVGISEIIELFSINPNPVFGTLNINIDEPITDCQIFNLQGQLVYSNQSDVKEVATDGWTSGVYIIRITTVKGVAEKRFVKN